MLIIGFDTATFAMAFENIMKNVPTNGKIIPLPKKVSANCGLAWCDEVDKKEMLCQILNKNSIQHSVHIILMYY